MKAVTISTLRSKLKYYFDLVSESLEVIIVPRNNDDDDAVVIISLKEYNALKETEYLLASKANRERIDESIQQLKDGETIRYELED